ncbi:MAG TPA: UvrD-helicase domain-containing protein [Methanocorpusculum sp.]|nr:UvrD-helicase domain-containing protein [Methanocorpusculum sp.]
MSETNYTPAQKEALNLSHRRCCVTASAGTGKTFVLTQRYIAHLKAGAAAGEILCLTFTEKAAAEMREKIEREVKKTLDDADEKMAAGVPAGLSDAEYRNLHEALKDIHRCTISTFHGFCSSVLKEFPIESQTPLGYAVMDELAEQELVANTIADILEHPDDNLRPYAVCLYSAFAANVVPKLITGLLKELQVCPQWFEKLETDEGRKEIYDAWETDKKKIPALIKNEILHDSVIREFIELSKSWEVLIGLNGTAVELFNKLVSEDELNIDTLSAFCRQKISNTQTNPVPKKLVKLYNHSYSPEGSSFKQLSSSLQHYDFDDPHTQLMFSVMQALYKITAAAADKVEAKKTAAGYLNFDDLITSAESLLTDEKISSVLAKRYRYVLVDEVQDNDSSLTRIINRLAGNDDDSLFIVGDMKQSIYRFRGADPECVQNELFSTFPKDGWVTLDTNFRTVQRLIDAVNILFTRLYPEGNDEHIPYEPVKAYRSSGICPETAGTLTLLRSSGKTSDEADLLTRWIGKSVEDADLLVEENGSWHPAEYRDFAVLVRSGTSGEYVKNAFDALGIPYHDCSGDKMYTSVEIRDLLSVIRSAVCREDDAALYAALKSPYFGITDAELAFAAYSADKHPDNLWRRLKSFIADDKLPKWVKEGAENEDVIRFAADTRKNLTSALSLLELFARTAVSDTLPHLIRLIYETTGILSVYAALSNGTDRISNLHQFLAVSDHISAERGVSVYEFLRIIDTCIDKNIDNDYSSDGEPSAENRVQIMTYHVSKGLEFPVVALFQTGKKYDDHIENLMVDDTYGAGHSALKYPGDDEPLFRFLQSMIVRKERPVSLREEKRLFYVGMTRARDHLAITVTEEGSEESYMELFSKGDEELKSMTAVLEDVEWTPDISSLQAVFDNDWRCVSSADEAERDSRLADISRELTETKEERTARFEEEKKRLQEAKSRWENIRRGLCIHEIFEGKNPEEVCRTYGCEGEQKKFEAALKFFRKSDLLQNAVGQIHELPLTTADGEYRRADLFVKYADGTYAIFDYKSSASASVDALLREKYTAQLTEYSEILSAVYQTKEKIPAYLYYVGDRKFVRVV